MALRTPPPARSPSNLRGLREGEEYNETPQLYSGRKADAVLADLLDGDARMALHDDELAAGIAALAQLCQPLEIVTVPDTVYLRDELGVREIGGILMDVIVEQIAVELGDAGVERIFRPGNRAEPP